MQLAQRSVLPVFAILLGGLLALATLPIAPAMAAVDASSSQAIDLEIVTEDGAVSFATGTVTMDNDEEKLTVKNSLDHSVSLHVEDRDIGVDLESGQSASLDVSSLKSGAYTLALSGHGSARATLLVK